LISLETELRLLESELDVLDLIAITDNDFFDVGKIPLSTAHLMLLAR
jgi:hypothetical protein